MAAVADRALADGRHLRLAGDLHGHGARGRLPPDRIAAARLCPCQPEPGSTPASSSSVGARSTWLTGVRRGAPTAPRPPDDEPHADQRLEQRLAAPPQVPRRHPEQPLGVRPGPSRQRPLGPGDDRHATDRPPVELLGAKRMRPQLGVSPRWLPARPQPVESPTSESSVPSQGRSRRSRARRRRARTGGDRTGPDSAAACGRPRCGGRRSRAARRPRVPRTRASARTPNSECTERSPASRYSTSSSRGSPDRLKQRPRDGAPRRVPGRGQPLGDRRHRLRGAGATQTAHAERRSGTGP